MYLLAQGLRKTSWPHQLVQTNEKRNILLYLDMFADDATMRITRCGPDQHEDFLIVSQV